ncbi:DUF2304 domain-containing protein [Psychrobacillus sp. NPDC096623]|uniref:DUF2304 domain-containing protein n=1 Tax=Psychrobacillus sp. NPDC096623 TaxID=3364492 RepID=UPI003821A57C
MDDTIIATTLFLLQVIWLTAKNKLSDKHVFTWIIFSIGDVIVALGLPYINEIAAKLGISYMRSLIFKITFLIILPLLIYHTITISKHDKNIKNLVPEVAY